MKTILLVTENADERERLRAALNERGHWVTGVEDRQQALRAAADQAPDLVIVSSEIPGAAELVKSFGTKNGGPGALLLAPADRTEEAFAIYEAGAERILSEPVRVPDLVAAAEQAMAAPRDAVGPVVAAAGRVFTAAEIFGDVLAEVETGGAAPAAAPAEAPAPVEVPPAAPVEEAPVAAIEPVPAEPPAPVFDASPAAPVEEAPVAAVEPVPAELPAPVQVPQPAAVAEIPPAPVAEASPAEPDEQVPAAPVEAPAPVEVPPTAPIEEAPVAAVEPVPAEPPAPVFDVAPAEPDEQVPAEPPAPVQVPPPAPVAEIPPAPVSEASPAEPEEQVPPVPVEDSRAVPVAPVEVPPAAPVAEELAAPVASVEMLPPAPAAEPPPPPTDRPVRFGQYELEERLAVGGMAEVWRARMSGVEGFSKTVAVKKILPHLAESREFVRMFIDEAKLAAELSHENIVHIYDLGKIGQEYYLAMEYVEGRDLRAILNALRGSGRRFPPELALLVAARLAGALAHAHRAHGRDAVEGEPGLVHRDVSPRNVLIGREGHVKLCDFGIAKAASTVSRTRIGVLKGKLPYMSPEQASGGAVDGRTDLFSLGAVLFEMLTGEALFAGDGDIGLLEKVRACRVRGPRTLVPSLPKELDRLVRRALRKDPGKRFQSAGEMERQLEGALRALGAAPGRADLADFVDELFAPPREAEPALAAVPPVVAAAATTAPGDADAPAVPGRGLRRGHWIAAAAAALAVAAVGLGLLATREGEPPRTERAEAVATALSAAPERPAADPAPVATAEPSAPAPAAAPLASGPEVAAVPSAPETVVAAEEKPGPAAAEPIDVEAIVGRELERRETELRQALEAEERRLQRELERLESQSAAGRPPA